ncbi:MAG: hypothetical protein CL920_38990 [Deltaproteobacteria bacterium]|nr:hypothetical protein [Deltaproteobacteria bacterium]
MWCLLPASHTSFFLQKSPLEQKSLTVFRELDRMPPTYGYKPVNVHHFGIKVMAVGHLVE